MMKKYKNKILVTSLITISPMFIGMLIWNQLPEQIATHFGSDNIPNDWSSKATAVFGIPLFLLFAHLLCVIVTLNDPKKQNLSDKILSLLFWMVPVVSLFVNLSCYGIALGYVIDIGVVAGILVGIMFILIGNYLPKIKQNYSVGIKIPWTLSSEENWNRTHHLASRLWILCGLGFIFNCILHYPYIQGILIAAAVVIPLAYSFILYRKGI